MLRVLFMSIALFWGESSDFSKRRQRNFGSPILRLRASPSTVHVQVRYQGCPHLLDLTNKRLPLLKSTLHSQMASSLESVVSNFSFMLEQNSRLITAVGTLSAISFAVTPILEQIYQVYIKAGRGGLSPNVYGWTKSSP